MSLITVKCNSCNVVINELLAFLRNVLDVMDEESVHQLCTSSFTAEEIVKAKTLLFESIPSGKKMPVRRKNGKKRVSRDLDDMICLLKGSDPELFPIFVAKELHKLPPVSFDHVDVTRLLKDLLQLQNKVSALEQKVVTTEQFDLFKAEVENMKYSSILDYSVERNVNKRRGAYLQNSINLDSGPIGLQYVPIKGLQITADSNDNGSARKNTSSTPDQCDNNCISVSQEQRSATENRRHVGEREGTEDPVSASENECVTSHATSPTSGQRANAVTALSHASVSSEICGPPAPCDAVLEATQSARWRDVVVSNVQTVGGVDVNTEWKVVHNKRYKQNRISSQKGRALTAPEGKFRAADIKVPLLISNVSTEASEDDIISYIKDKTNEIVTLKKINMKSFRKYNAFKLYVSKHKVDLFLNDEFWPDGIVFRRFVHFMYRMKPQELKVKVS